MSLRDAVERLLLADATRFERRILAMMEAVLARCSEPRTCTLIEELIAEEHQHLASLDAVSEDAADECEDATLKSGYLFKGETVCEMLREISQKEQASITFYALLADRTPVPGIRHAFQQIAEGEKGHVKRLAEHILAICGG